VLLVVGGIGHDFDYVRLQLLTELARYPNVRAILRDNYEDVVALERVDAIISYTVRVGVDAETADTLRRFVATGHRWLAMHGTLAMPEAGPLEPGGYDASWDEFFGLMGARYMGHAPIMDFKVEMRSDASRHEALKGLSGSFSVNDELYVLSGAPDIRVLLEATYMGPLEGPSGIWQDDRPVPVAHSRTEGRGTILYVSLGHRHGRWDLDGVAPLDVTPVFGSWESDEFRRLIENSVNWVTSRP
jgi:type 1 glutamine amidotransferase